LIQYDPQIYASMQRDEPFATYKKTILGKIYLTVLSPFDDKPVGLILEGFQDEKSASIDTWSEKEDLFLRRLNARQFEVGNIIKVKREPVDEDTSRSIEQYSDEELRTVINKKYLGFRAVLDNVTSEAVAYRMVELARDMEKSEKIVGAIEKHLSHLQLKDLQPLVKKETEII